MSSQNLLARPQPCHIFPGLHGSLNCSGRIHNSVSLASFRFKKQKYKMAGTAESNCQVVMDPAPWDHSYNNFCMLKLVENLPRCLLSRSRKSHGLSPFTNWRFHLWDPVLLVPVLLLQSRTRDCSLMVLTLAGLPSLVLQP